MHDLKYKIYFYTEGKLLEMLEEIINATSKNKPLRGKKLGRCLDTLVDHLIKVTKHPKEGDLIFHPNSPESGKPGNILKIVKEWRCSQGLPLFKDPERALSRICHLKIIAFWLSGDFRYEKVMVAIAVIISNMKRKHRQILPFSPSLNIHFTY